MRIIEWMKAHPWTTGAIVLGGGVAFIVFSGWFGGSSGGVTVNQPGMSDAEISANAAIEAAKIQAQAQAGSTAAGVETARILAELEGTRANYEYLLGMQNIDLQEQLGLASIEASIANNYLTAQTVLGTGAQQAQVMTALITSQTKKGKQKYIGQNMGGVFTGLAPLSSIYSGVGGSTTGGTSGSNTGGSGAAPVTGASVGGTTGASTSSGGQQV